MTCNWRPFASANGRQLHVISQGEGDESTAIVLGWQGVDPQESTQAPKLARRTLPRFVIKILVIFHALNRDPRVVHQPITTEAISAAFERVAGPNVGGNIEKTLVGVLTTAGLVTHGADGWRPGPKMLTWDVPTKAVMDHAAERLWAHPLWPGARHA